jgi:hypothetical protein
MMRPRVFQKRRGALPPIITVLIIIAAVIATGLVVWFMTTTTSKSVRTPIVSVVGQPTLYANGQIYVTFKNDGTASVTLQGATIVVQDVNKNPVPFSYSSGPATLNPGQSASYIFNFAGNSFNFGNIPDGALATLQTTDGYQLSFAVAKP